MMCLEVSITGSWAMGQENWFMNQSLAGSWFTGFPPLIGGNHEPVTQPLKIVTFIISYVVSDLHEIG